MKNATLVLDFTTIAIYSRAPKNVALYQGLGHEVMAVEIRYGELMYSIIDNHWGEFSPWDIFNCSANNNECPIKAMDRAKKNGHRIYTMLAHGTCISRFEEDKKEALIIDTDVNYYYCGKLFKMVTEPNGNFGLVEIEQPIELK